MGFLFEPILCFPISSIVLEHAGDAVRKAYVGGVCGPGVLPLTLGLLVLGLGVMGLVFSSDWQG